MKELKDMTAAELVRRLEDCNHILESLREVGAADSETNRIVESKAARIAELDARLEKYGLRIGLTGKFEAKEEYFGDLFGGHSRLIIDPTEFIALGGYLLSKEVKP